MTAENEAFDRTFPKEVPPHLLWGPVRPLDWPLRRLVIERPDLRGLLFVTRGPVLLDTERKALYAVSAMHEDTWSSLGRTSGFRAITQGAVERLQTSVRSAEAAVFVGGTWLLKPEVRAASPGRLEQVFQIYPEAVRASLTSTLGKIKGDEAKLTLACRAVFDFSATVRARSTDALLDAKREVVRLVFLNALRHPLPAAADHATLALVACGTRRQWRI